MLLSSNPYSASFCMWYVMDMQIRNIFAICLLGFKMRVFCFTWQIFFGFSFRFCSSFVFNHFVIHTPNVSSPKPIASNPLVRLGVPKVNISIINNPINGNTHFNHLIGTNMPKENIARSTKIAAMNERGIEEEIGIEYSENILNVTLTNPSNIAIIAKFNASPMYLTHE